jgi:Leucine-rich repeat (LRR) protein
MANMKDLVDNYLHQPKRDNLRLFLNNNKLEKIEGLDRDELISLERLVLFNNRLTKLENLDKLVNLTRLDIYNNRISQIEGINNLKKLKWLDSSYNQIQNTYFLNDNNLSSFVIISLFTKKA